MKRVLITGATGFVGANLARRLLEEGYEVHALVRESFNPWRIEEIASQLAIESVDMRDFEATSKYIDRVKPEWIFHLAAHGAYSWQNNVGEIVATNYLSLVNLLQACLHAGFESFINTGSSSEYGLKDHAPEESEAIEPNSYYAVTKASATLFCRFVAQHHRVNVPTLRLYSVYGPYEDPKRFIPNIVARGLEGKWPVLVDPDTARDYIYVSDVCDAYLAAAARLVVADRAASSERASSERAPDPGAIYNIGTGEQTTIRQVVEVAGELMPISETPEWGSMAARQWDTSIWVSNIEKSKRELAWQPRITLKQGLSQTIEWFNSPAGHLSYYRHCLGLKPMLTQNTAGAPRD